MKIAICKGGTNITFSSGNRSAANADIKYAVNQLSPREIDITMVTATTRNTYFPNILNVCEINKVDFNNYDLILLFNFSINFFGGAEDPNLLNLYRKLSKTKTKIAYVQTDGQLPFKQLWPSISKREWAKGYKESDFYIDPENVIYISQGRDIFKVRKEINKKEDNIKPYDIFYYPWAQTILATGLGEFRVDTKLFDKRPYDLIFGGATRNAHKRKKIEHFFTNPRHNNYLFGNLRGLSVPVNKAVSYQRFIQTMMKGKGTVIVGDFHYENNYITLRMYESILAGCLTYIDKKLDNGFFYKGKFPELHIDSSEDILPFDNTTQELCLEAKSQILNDYDETTSRRELHDLLRICQ
jgi:hypothetical protein